MFSILKNYTVNFNKKIFNFLKSIFPYFFTIHFSVFLQSFFPYFYNQLIFPYFFTTHFSVICYNLFLRIFATKKAGEIKLKVICHKAHSGIIPSLHKGSRIKKTKQSPNLNNLSRGFYYQGSNYNCNFPKECYLYIQGVPQKKTVDEYFKMSSFIIF